MTPAKGFAEMKDSGIEWIGEIPAHWNLTRLQSQLYEINEINNPVKTTQVLSLTNKLGVIPYEEKGNQGNKAKEDFTGYKIAYPSCIVANSMNILIGSVGLSQYYGCVSPVYYVFRAKDSANIKFLNYLFSLPSFQKELRKYANGILEIRLRVSSGNILRRKIALPPPNEQATIVSYLDAQCAKIDEIIAQAKASIEDYKQWKASIIYEAVTKGLDPNVEMKDSGIEWIGRMPAHWTAPALKHLCTMQAGKNLISEQISTSGRYPVYGGNGQRGYYSDYNVNGNFLLVGRQGALCGNVHCVSGKFWATEHAVVTTPSKITNISYLYYLLIAMDLNQYASNSAAQPGLSVGNILTVKTLLPPIDEQVRISEFLDNCCPRIDEVITEKQSLIDDLESYKKSLIYEVVTGKRRVC